MSTAADTIDRSAANRGALGAFLTVLRDSIATLNRYQFDAPWRHDGIEKR